MMSNSVEPSRSLPDFAHEMKRDWDDRARENAKWYINTIKREQSDESGKQRDLPKTWSGAFYLWSASLGKGTARKRTWPGARNPTVRVVSPSQTGRLP